MLSSLDALLDRLGKVERELETEFDAARVKWRYRIDGGRVRFEHDVRLAHQRLRQRIPPFLLESSIRNLLVAPLIYSLILPLALLDLWISVYQAVCFRAFGIARVRRSTYIVIDRNHLGYLNAIEKLHCVFCGYGNGVIAYAREVAGRTEQYWCPIRHATRVHGPHAHYRHFIDYGDAEGYKKRLIPLRQELREDRSARNEGTK